ncbi:MAG: N-acetyltransferase [Solirubrobacterales bacterium]|nr:N-acetyltransferase [Solirubrobacterales bacterium]
MIRHADPDRDAAACAAIYAPAVTDGVASMEERAPGPEAMADRIRATTRNFPWLVAELDGEVAGYAYAGPHRDRPAYRWACDVAVYVAAGGQRRGVGRALYERLFELLACQGYYEACAGITVPNAASVGLHETMGFTAIGRYRDIAYKQGRWLTVGWWQKSLRARGGAAPGPIRPPLRRDEPERP